LQFRRVFRLLDPHMFDRAIANAPQTMDDGTGEKVVPEAAERLPEPGFSPSFASMCAFRRSYDTVIFALISV
jgi:hypothetical protein